MRLIFIIACLLSSQLTGAQKSYSPFAFYNSGEFWENVRLDSSAGPLALKASDTAIVVVSNRKPQPDSLRWMSEERDEGRLRYYVAKAEGAHWTLRQFGDLAAAVAALPARARDWVVYTEGMGKIFTSDLDRGFKMAGLYRVNVIMMDYPSIRSDYRPWRNYRFAKHSAIDAYEDFVPVIDSVRSLRERGALGSGHLSLFFHSMGNKVLREAVLRHRLEEMNGSVWVDNLIINAACVPQQGHRAWIDPIRFAKRIYIHYNPDDGTLKWARILSLHKQLGDRPRRPLSSKVTYINFNALCGAGHSNFLNLWGPYMARREALVHYNTVLHGREVKPDGEHYAQSAYRGIGLDILPLRRQGPPTVRSGKH